MSDNTIKEIIGNGYTVHAYCNACRYNAEVSLAELPPDMTVRHLRENLRCGECGSANTAITISVKIGADRYH